MKKRKNIIIKILIVFISVLCVDGGRSFMMTGNKIQILLNHDHNDIEEPHLHQLFSLNDDDKLIESFKFDFSFHDKSPLKFLFTSVSSTQEFTRSIWQPPKFI